MMKVLIVESEFLHQDTWVGNAVERLADALSQQNVTVIKSTSFDDGFAILSSNEAIDCLMFSRLYRRTRRCRDDPLPPAAIAATVQRADEI